MEERLIINPNAGFRPSVALALTLGIRLATGDQQVLRAFPGVAAALKKRTLSASALTGRLGSLLCALLHTESNLAFRLDRHRP